MEDLSFIKTCHIQELYKRMLRKEYSCAEETLDPEDEEILTKCIALWKLDYECELLGNHKGNDYEDTICSSYPSRIPIPVAELQRQNEADKEEPQKSILFNRIRDGARQKSECSEDAVGPESSAAYNLNDVKLLDVPFSLHNERSNDQSVEEGDKGAGKLDVHSYRQYSVFCSLARCHYRFVVPTIFANGKYICRSATVAHALDSGAREMWSYYESPADNKSATGITWDLIKSFPSRTASTYRAYDIRLLKTIGVSAIMDLMIENKKTWYAVEVTSSEKIDAVNRYADFQIRSIPYPGCEYFAKFVEHGLSDQLKLYDWTSSNNNAELNVPKTNVSSKVTKEWENYKTWNISTLTAHYLRLMLKYILDEDSEETGLLVHCISGWDRTPLFISLLRLSLWADGKAHKSLSPKQMLFFTLAYDWYFFGHQYPTRYKAKENILFFCFEFLDQIADEDFVNKGIEKRERHPSNASSASEFEQLSIGSIDSLSSQPSSTSVTPSKTLAVPNVKILPVSTHMKASPIKPEGANRWPFENRKFSFVGISDKEGSENVVPGGQNNTVFPKQSSPIRSPLRERNKCSPKSSPSQKSGRSGRKSINGLLRGLTGSRPRKSSVTELQNFEELDSSYISEPEKTVEEDSFCIPQITASKPVPVPGARARLGSSESSGGDSWTPVPSSALDDYLKPVSWQSEGSDSFKGRKFEPSGGAVEGQERIHKREHLIQIKNTFKIIAVGERGPPTIMEKISSQATQMIKSMTS